MRNSGWLPHPARWRWDREARTSFAARRRRRQAWREAIWRTILSHMTARLAGSETQDVLAFLGGRKTLGLAPRAQANYVDLVRRGLPYQALRAVVSALDMSLGAVQAALQLSPRSLQRRRDARLTPVESERILRLARVAARASYVLGDRASALRWLVRPNRALAGEVPVRLLDTDVGTAEVIEVLDRVLYGVYT